MIVVKIYIKPLVEQKMKKKKRCERSQANFQDTILMSLEAGDAVENSSEHRITKIST